MELEPIIDVIYEKCIERKEEESKVKTPEEHDTEHKKTLDYYRIHLEPYIYNYLTWQYGPKLDEFWKTHEFPEKSKYAWVMVERRPHPNTWFLLRNIAWAAPYMSLYIFCSNMNYNFIKDTVGDKKNIHIIPWFEGFVSREEGKEQYNRTFKMADFYKSIDAEYIVTIQTDCFFRKKIPESIFVGDYYGAPWAWSPDEAGGGGITVRRLAAMIQSLETVPYSEGCEDGWIGNAVKTVGGHIPSFEFREKVFSENFPVQDPVGVHQFWTFIENFDIQEPNTLREHYRRYLKFDM
jgi:hypothetical protein